MIRYTIRRRRGTDGAEYGPALIFDSAQHAITSGNGADAAELVRQANAAAELREALSALSERVESEVAYGDQWPEVRAAAKLLDGMKP